MAKSTNNSTTNKPPHPELVEGKPQHPIPINNKYLYATASRDLKKGIDLQLFEGVGKLNKTKYVVKK